MGTMRLTVDVRDRGLQQEVNPDQLRALLADKKNRIWLDISDPSPAEVALLRREFGFHELALEEVTKPHERPRCDAYGGYYFIVVYAAEQTGTRFEPRELNLFWGENYLVTIHRRPSAVLTVLEEARRRWEQHEGRQPHGIACLAYTLFESLVDGYFVVESRVRERIEAIEEKIFKGSEGAAADLFRLRKELLRVPRLLAPTSHVLAELDTYRDLLGAALDVQVFYSFNRLGHIMKRLTAVTVIIMVPNFVASIFGMNFAHIPAGNWQLGFVVVSAFLLCMVAWGFIHSRFMGWL